MIPLLCSTQEYGGNTISRLCCHDLHELDGLLHGVVQSINRSILDQSEVAASRNLSLWVGWDPRRPVGQYLAPNEVGNEAKV